MPEHPGFEYSGSDLYSLYGKIADPDCADLLSECGVIVVENGRGLEGPWPVLRDVMITLLDAQDLFEARTNLGRLRARLVGSRSSSRSVGSAGRGLHMDALSVRLTLLEPARRVVVDRELAPRWTPQAASPPRVRLDPPSGRHDGPFDLRVVSDVAAASVHYTLDGSTPTPDCPTIVDRLRISENVEIKVVAVHDGVAGPVASGAYELVSPTPDVSPDAGMYDPPLTVLLTCTDPGATIHYTTDGTEPTEASPSFEPAGPLVLHGNTELRAKTFVNGWLPSDTVSKSFILERPEWRTLEPEDRSDAVSHEDAIFRERAVGGSFEVVGASIRGKLHAHRGAWREDAIHVDQVGSTLIVGVSDGAGSSRLSRVGSHLAVDVAVSTIRDWLKQSTLIEGVHEFQLTGGAFANVLLDAFERAHRAIVDESAKRQVHSTDLSATLLVVVAGNDATHGPCVVGAQIGDGLIAFRRNDGTTGTLGVQESGQYSGETTFITHRSAVDRVRVGIQAKASVDMVAVMTDGVSDDLIPYDESSPGLFRELNTRLDGASDSPESLLQWLKYDKAGSTDDRSIVLIRRVDG